MDRCYVPGAEAGICRTGRPTRSHLIRPASGARCVPWRALGVVVVALAAGCAAGATEPDAPPSCLDRAQFGDPAASPYALPYPMGKSYPVLQGYCSNGSHRDRFAYDFLMGFGDTVVAARGGVVRVLVEDWTDDDKDGSHNNYLFLTHDDGTVALYAHFEHQGIIVEPGARVSPGTPLGTAGESGTPTPCPFLECGILHFGVYASWPPQEPDEVPINFRNADGPLDERGGLMAGATYLATQY
jgi:murein DD-endopeptidase MepM/ murein hydrolase activator NlpD